MRTPARMLLLAVLLPLLAAAQSPDPKPDVAPLRFTGPVEVKKQVTPTYPAEAQSKRIQGRAVLDFVVSEKGTVVRTEPVSGDSLLVTAFADAAKNWTFVPVKKDGHPVAIITRIGMDFLLIENVRDNKIDPLVELASPDTDVAGIQGLSPDALALDPRIMAGRLLNRIPPLYPPVARYNRISGSVHLQALIGKDGHIAKLTVIDGHPWLAQAAIDAVKQWRYSPYKVNGEPVNVQTKITVNFMLGG